MDTIFAGNKPFNLTNKVIFVQSPEHRAGKKSGTFAKKYTRGKNEFLSTGNTLRFPTSESFDEAGRPLAVSADQSENSTAMLVVQMQRNRFVDARRYVTFLCKITYSMKMTDVNYIL